LIEKDQGTNAKGDDVSGPKEDPLPQPEPLVEDQNVTNEGKQDDGHKDGTNPKHDAHKADSEVKDKEVNFRSFFSTLLSLRIFNCFN
jgi:hypothetical protein